MAESNLIEFDPDVPLQHQIYLQVRQEIEDGLWLGRDDFPGEKELGQRYGVSVITSRAALDKLADQGLVERRRGRGTRAVYQPRPAEAVHGPALFPVGQPRPYRYRLLFAEVRMAPAEACRAFDMPFGSQLWQCSRLRFYDSRIHSVTHNAQRIELGSGHGERELRTEPMAVILRSRGIQLARMRRRIGVAYPTPLVAEQLGVTAMESLLVVTMTLFDSADQPVEWVRIYLHPQQQAPEEVMDLDRGTWSVSGPL